MLSASSAVAGGLLFLDADHRFHSIAMFALVAVTAYGAWKLPKEYDV